MAESPPAQDALYHEAASTYGGAIERLARGYEPDDDRRRDLVQDIHVALWRSFAGYAGRASMRTWVYRVAHNTAISRVVRRRAKAPTLVTLDEAADVPSGGATPDPDHARALDHLLALIRTLTPLDRQVILLYLEELDAQAIADITGLSPGNVATKVHRIKHTLARRFAGGPHD